MDNAPGLDRETEMLKGFAGFAYAAAERLHERVQAAETTAEIAEASGALHVMGRTLRQTVALIARLKREAERDAREGRAEARGDTETRARRRRIQVEGAVKRLIWTEYEDDEEEAERLETLLTEHLDEDEITDAVFAQPIEAHIARICAVLGIEPPAAATSPEAISSLAEDAPRRSSG